MRVVLITLLVIIAGCGEIPDYPGAPSGKGSSNEGAYDDSGINTSPTDSFQRSDSARNATKTGENQIRTSNGGYIAVQRRMSLELDSSQKELKGAASWNGSIYLQIRDGYSYYDNDWEILELNPISRTFRTVCQFFYERYIAEGLAVDDQYFYMMTTSSQKEIRVFKRTNCEEVESVKLTSVYLGYCNYDNTGLFQKIGSEFVLSRDCKVYRYNEASGTFPRHIPQTLNYKDRSLGDYSQNVQYTSGSHIWVMSGYGGYLWRLSRSGTPTGWVPLDYKTIGHSSFAAMVGLDGQLVLINTGSYYGKAVNFVFISTNDF